MWSNAKPISLFSSIVVRSQVLIHRNDEKERSALEFVTGKVLKIFRSMWIVGYTSLSQSCRDSRGEVGSFLILAFVCSFHFCCQWETSPFNFKSCMSVLPSSILPNLWVREMRSSLTWTESKLITLSGSSKVNLKASSTPWEKRVFRSSVTVSRRGMYVEIL